MYNVHVHCPLHGAVVPLLPNNSLSAQSQLSSTDRTFKVLTFKLTNLHLTLYNNWSFWWIHPAGTQVLACILMRHPLLTQCEKETWRIFKQHSRICINVIRIYFVADAFLTGYYFVVDTFCDWINFVAEYFLCRIHFVSAPSIWAVHVRSVFTQKPDSEYKIWTSYRTRTCDDSF